MVLDRQKLKSMRVEIESKLNELNESLGVKFTLGNCTYSPDEARWSLTALVEGGKSKEERDLKFHVALHRLDTEKLWRDGTHVFKLYGYRNRARKCPYLIKDTLTDKVYAITQAMADLHFKRSA